MRDCEIEPAFLEFSQELGNDILHIQGAGGNTSIKTDAGMWVKASGMQLKDCINKDCFIYLQRNESGSYIPSFCNDNKPSIETSLHIGLQSKYVVHTHFLNAIAHTIAINLRSTLPKKLKGISWAYIPYAMPGQPLWSNIQRIISNKVPDILILENHGVIFTGDDLVTIRNNIACLEKRLKLPTIAHGVSGNKRDLSDIKIAKFIWSDSIELNSISRDEELARKFVEEPFYPDQVVFLNNVSTYCKHQDLDFVVRSHPNVKCIVMLGYGVLIAQSNSDFMLDMLKAHAILLNLVANENEFSTLDLHQCSELLNWDAEKYRKKLNGR